MGQNLEKNKTKNAKKYIEEEYEEEEEANNDKRPIENEATTFFIYIHFFYVSLVSSSL